MGAGEEDKVGSSMNRGQPKVKNADPVALFLSLPRELIIGKSVWLSG